VCVCVCVCVCVLQCAWRVEAWMGGGAGDVGLGHCGGRGGGIEPEIERERVGGRDGGMCGWGGGFIHVHRYMRCLIFADLAVGVDMK
jgi:hypothetical protein